jgi:RNA polymerase sigma-70 factor (ECF subfamily)
MNLKKVISRCLRKDERAFVKLYNYYAPTFSGVCRRYANSSDEANDMLQESFIKIFNNLDRLKDLNLFESWGKRIVINTAIQTIKQRNAFNLSIDHLSIEISEEEESKSTELLDRLDIMQLIKLMDYLPEGYKTILNLHTVEGFTHKEISEMINIKEATSRSQFFKAKRCFQKILVEKTTHIRYEEFSV